MINGGNNLADLAYQNAPQLGGLALQRQSTVAEEFGRWTGDIERLRAMVQMSLEAAHAKAREAAADITMYHSMLRIFETTLKSCAEPKPSADAPVATNYR